MRTWEGHTRRAIKIQIKTIWVDCLATSRGGGVALKLHEIKNFYEPEKEEWNEKSLKIMM